MDSRIKTIKELKEQKSCYMNWFEEGGAQITYSMGQYDLYEVPQYGGEPVYVDSFTVNELDGLLNIMDSWT